MSYYPRPEPMPPSNPGGQGQLLLHLSKPGGPRGAAMMTPVVKIDGVPASARWDHNGYLVPAGRHNVAVEIRYWFAFGQQQMVVNVAPQQSTQIYYAAPLITFSAGAMGYQPQERPGKLGFALAVGVPVGLVLVVAVVLLFQAFAT